MELLTVNHYPVLMFSKTGKNEGVVLCMRTDVDYEKFVTWVISWDEDGAIAAYWGDYFKYYSEAEKSFLHRMRLYTRDRVVDLV